MNRFNQILLAILALQVLIAGGIFVASQPASPDDIQSSLLAANKDEIDKIIIARNDHKQILLRRVNGQWQLPDYYQLSASQARVNDMLDKLQTTKSGWPVATTQSSHQRFEVSDNNFQKKIILANGDNERQTIYLGSSPGFRQLHIRKKGDDEVYAVKLNSFEFQTESSDWLDKNLLQPKQDIVSLKGPDFSFDKQDSHWQLVNGDGEIIEESLNKLTDTLARLTVQEAAEKPSGKIDYELSVTTVSDKLIYQFFKANNQHFITRNDYEQAFKMNASDYENITSQTAKQLVKQTTASEKQPPMVEGKNKSPGENTIKSDNQQS
ncbi:MAG: DUF4340 domain-containing protein [Gammaproteobacteria bacterium]